MREAPSAYFLYRNKENVMQRLQKIILGSVCASMLSMPALARDDSPGPDRAEFVQAKQASQVTHLAQHKAKKKKQRRREKARRERHRSQIVVEIHGHEYHHDEVTYDYARVIDVEPVVRLVEVETPERHCWEEPVQRHYGGGGHDSITRLILGGIFGSVVGNQFGGGAGKDLLTVGGAILGASVGYDSSRHYRGGGYRTELETRCEVSYRPHHEEHIDGYRVTYVYNGRTYVRHMQHTPGRRIKIRVKQTPLM
jgi:uncharacterized protein YcfJ